MQNKMQSNNAIVFIRCLFDSFNQNCTITYPQISVDIYSYESEHKMLIIQSFFLF